MSAPLLSTTSASAQYPRRHRWLRWLGALLLLLGMAVAVALWQLDPWLRRTLEKQVAEKSHGRYQLRIGALRTDLRRRTITLRDIRLRPAAGDAAAPDSLPAPWIELDIKLLRLSGVGLGAALRREVVPVDSLLIQTVRARVLKTPDDLGQQVPLHERLPPRLAGVHLGHLAVRNVRVTSGPPGRPTASLRQGSLTATDIELSRAGAADRRRLGYAARVELRGSGLEAVLPTHRVRMGSFLFSSAQKQMVLDSLRVEPLAGAGQPGSARIKLWLPQAALRGLRTEQLGARRLLADTLRIVSPGLTLRVAAKKTPALHEALAPYLRQVRLAHVRLTRGRLELEGVEHAPVLQHIDIRGEDVQLDTASHLDAQRVLYARAWEVHTGPGQLSLDAPYYRLAYQRLRLATRPGSLRLDELVLRPQMSLTAMARRKGHMVSHITLRVPRVQLAGLDYGALLRKQEVRVQSISLTSPRLDVRGNSKFPINPRPSVVTPEKLRQVPLRLDVRRLRIRGGTMNFTFLGKQARRHGTARITQLTGTATNLTNDPRRTAQPAVLQASATFQGQCRVQATGWFQLNDAQGRHRIVGSFGKAPFAILNSITVPARFARFEQGQVQRIRFDARFDRQGASGTMWARYSDLKLTLLSRNGGADKESLGSKIKTKLVDGIIIRDHNPRGKDGQLEPGKIRSQREPRFSVFALWLQGMTSGLLNSIGVPGPIAKSASEQ